VGLHMIYSKSHTYTTQLKHSLSFSNAGPGLSLGNGLCSSTAAPWLASANGLRKPSPMAT